MVVQKKTAIITGAGRRLGLFVVERLISAGWHIHALTREMTDGLMAVNSECLYVHELGSYTTKDVMGAIDGIHAKQQGQPVHLLLNNASIFENDARVADNGVSSYEAMIFVHMIMPSLLAKGLLDVLSDEDAPGNIISITDIYATNPNPSYSLYCSTKAGLENLSYGFAKKYAPSIRANAIQPGPIKFLPEHDTLHQEKVLAETLLPYEGGFLPIYQAIEFILDNQYLTGSVIKVDGGRSLMRG